MRSRSNRLLMLLIASALAACSTQSERGSTGTESQAPAAAPTPQPEYVPEREPVQYSDAPLPVTPAPQARQPVEEFPVTRYELPPEEEARPEPDLAAAEPAEEPEEEEEELLAEEDEPEEEPEVALVEPEAQQLVAEPVAAAPTPAPEPAVTQPRVAEEPVAQAQAPAAKPPAIQPVIVSFEAEPLFSFDKFNIRPDQRAKLDDLVAQLNGTEYESVSVTGHADRIGTDQYNRRLSERRANSVKAYLVRKGVPAAKIITAAMGESQPVTSNEDCKGKRGRALIACYQPDRRVEVTVTGKKMP
ncbi:MAG TPA: OmpA family protein [Burkholderiales bacterium]|nr:OmpA family protein [Burkholderiales bacterium]